MASAKALGSMKFLGLKSVCFWYSKRSSPSAPRVSVSRLEHSRALVALVGADAYDRLRTEYAQSHTKRSTLSCGYVDRARLAPRPQLCRASWRRHQPRGSTSSCLGAKHSPYLSDRAAGAIYMKRRGWEGENGDQALPEKASREGRGAKL